MTEAAPHAQLFEFIVNRINVGIVVVDREHRIVLWNRFLETHSGTKAEALIGQKLTEAFPDIPKKWLERKIKSVFVLKNYAFTHWKQRPYLFEFKHDRPITGGVDFMRQDCTLLPVQFSGEEVDYVCILVHDATDAAIYDARLGDALEKLEALSVRDGLTGIYNRRKMVELLEYEFNRSRRDNSPLSFLMMDLDHFKLVNDRYGHPAGDEVLVETTRRISKTLRSTDTFARYGGEEFAVVLPNTSSDGAKEVAERVCKAVRAGPVIFEEQEIPITVSLGASEINPEMKSINSLIDSADIALYYSKQTGRNRVTCFGPELPKLYSQHP